MDKHPEKGYAKEYELNGEVINGEVIIVKGIQLINLKLGKSICYPKDYYSYPTSSSAM